LFESIPVCMTLHVSFAYTFMPITHSCCVCAKLGVHATPKRGMG